MLKNHLPRKIDYSQMPNIRCSNVCPLLIIIICRWQKHRRKEVTINPSFTSKKPRTKHTHPFSNALKMCFLILLLLLQRTVQHVTENGLQISKYSYINISTHNICIFHEIQKNSNAPTLCTGAYTQMETLFNINERFHVLNDNSLVYHKVK